MGKLIEDVTDEEIEEYRQEYLRERAVNRKVAAPVVITEMTDEEREAFPKDIAKVARERSLYRRGW